MSSSNQNFLTGHSIDLRIPAEQDVLKNNWANWYNNQEKTKYNRHGIYPISNELEWEIVRREIQNPSSIVLAIYEKNTNRLIGNASLQNINLLNRHSDIAITIGESSPFTAGVETYGLLLEHAFTRLNLIRVHNATHEKLSQFLKMLSVVGFEYEGRAKQYFIKDGERSDAIYFAALADNYMKIKEKRNGCVLFETKEQLVDAIREALKQKDF
tara:strand:- start:7851 stop:8489 length:639 start_codon:yes stop_codon:yes gene_type:complete